MQVQVLKFKAINVSYSTYANLFVCYNACNIISAYIINTNFVELCVIVYLFVF